MLRMILPTMLRRWMRLYTEGIMNYSVERQPLPRSSIITVSVSRQLTCNCHCKCHCQHAACSNHDNDILLFSGKCLQDLAQLSQRAARRTLSAEILMSTARLGPQNLKWVTWPDHAHSGVACHLKAKTSAQNLTTPALAAPDIRFGPNIYNWWLDHNHAPFRSGLSFICWGLL